MNKKIIPILLLMTLTSCVSLKDPNLLFAIYPERIVNSSTVNLRYIVTDDKSSLINVSIYSDDNLLYQEFVLNNTLINITIDLDPNKEERIINLTAVDEAGNIGYAYMIVKLIDDKSPVFTLVEIYSVG